jgi:hypothetical protein
MVEETLNKGLQKNMFCPSSFLGKGKNTQTAQNDYFCRFQIDPFQIISVIQQHE